MRNPRRGVTHFFNGHETEEWSLDNVEVDYSQEEVNVQSFVGLLTARPNAANRFKKQLNSNSNSSVLIYMTGHGGDEFFKFHDSEEISAQDFAYALQEMHLKGRYKEVLLILDTCQAVTMSNYITAPGVTTLSSSSKGENSYAFQTDEQLGVAIVDRFTHSLYSYILGNIIKSSPTIAAMKNGPLPAQSQSQGSILHDIDDWKWRRSGVTLFDLHASFQKSILYSTATLTFSPQCRDPKTVKLADFFGQGNYESMSKNVKVGNGNKGGADSVNNKKSGKINSLHIGDEGEVRLLLPTTAVSENENAAAVQFESRRLWIEDLLFRQ